MAVFHFTAAALLLPQLLRGASAQPDTLRVYLLAGQSEARWRLEGAARAGPARLTRSLRNRDSFLAGNMEGQAEVATMNATSGTYKNGTLAYQVFVNQTTAPLFAPLWDKATQNWTVLDDVKIWYNENKTDSGVNGSVIPSPPGWACFGSLTTGFGSNCQGNLIGPEYGFGFGMHDASPGQKMLIVKTAWGGKDLAEDFRPPSSVANVAEDPFCTAAYCLVVGHYYQVMVADLHKMLAPGAIAAMFPDLAGLAPVLSGVGWQQGWNDGCDMNKTAAYEWNMVNLVKDLRAEFGNPTLPVSITVSGFNGFNGAEETRHPPGDWINMDPHDKITTTCTVDNQCRRLDIQLSQLAAANATRHPELGGHIVTMETRQFWRDPQFSPNEGQGASARANERASARAGSARSRPSRADGGPSTRSQRTPAITLTPPPPAPHASALPCSTSSIIIGITRRRTTSSAARWPRACSRRRWREERARAQPSVQSPARPLKERLLQARQ